MRIFTAEHRARIGAAARGRKQSRDVVERRTAKLRGRKVGPLSPEHLAAVRAAAAKRRGVPLSAEHRAKIGAGGRGKPKSKEHIQKLREAMIGKALATQHPGKLPKSVVIRRRHLKKSYGLTEEDVERMLSAQEGRCAICRSDDPAGKAWHVDHDHATGVVRGILCFRCNTMLGSARDNPETLAAAMAYLRKPKC